MPRHPDIARTVARMPGSVYSALAHRITTHPGEAYPLHVGDTWREPPAGCRMEDMKSEAHPGLHRYAPPHGRKDLLEALVARVVARTGVATDADNVLVAAGATAALGAVVGAIVDPGDEVLLLAPHWPLISGIVQACGARPVPVPFIGVADSPESAVEIVSAHTGERTVALYFNTPNNPSGRVIGRPVLEALVDWAARQDLWILADEVYEDLLFAGEHTYARALAPERTFEVHSFSKTYGMAGNRCGYIVGPRAVMREVQKIGTHTFYSTPTASQIAALRALTGGEAWLREARQEYARLGRDAAAVLGVPAPQGSTFLFIDVAAALDARGLDGFLSDCADRGLLVAPGPSFGPYPTHVRVCYTAAPPDVTGRGVRVLAELLARRRGA